MSDDLYFTHSLNLFFIFQISMNKVDKQYLELARDILEHGTLKNTRAGEVLSVFDRTLRFDLKEGLPLLTTKRVYTKGIIHELLWFLSGDTNIKYLIENKVNIWTDDAYRYYCELTKKHNANFYDGDKYYSTVELNSDTGYTFVSKLSSYDNVIAPDREFADDNFTIKQIDVISKEEFVEKVINKDSLLIVLNNKRELLNSDAHSHLMHYNYGDLGNIYGAKWRGKCGIDKNQGTDQVKQIIDTLKNNPDDRRMLCVAFDNDILNSEQGVALPPCHVMWQVYSREVSPEERISWYNKQHPDDMLTVDDIDTLDSELFPTRELSLMFLMRSNDYCAGNPFNVTSYSILLYILAELTNMIPGDVVGHFEDVHIYTNHIEGIKEQMSRSGCEYLPTLKFARKLTDIDNIKFEDIIINDYNPDPPIKYTLNVG